MSPRDVVRLARELRGQPLAAVDAELRRRQLDAETRLQVKLELQAAGTGGHTVTAVGELATDDPHQGARPSPELARTWRRLGLSTDAPVTVAELDQRLTAAGLSVEQRIAVKLDAEQQGLIVHGPEFPSEAARMVDTLGITGPMSLAALEALLDRHGIGSVTARTCIRSELQTRGWLRGGGPRSMRASADQGTGLTLRSRL
jgi:hypothetical protein